MLITSYIDIYFFLILVFLINSQIKKKKLTLFLKVRGLLIRTDVSFSQVCVSLLGWGVEVGTTLSPSDLSPCESEGLLPPAAGGAGSRRHSAVHPLQNCLCRGENATLAKATDPFPA